MRNYLLKSLLACLFFHSSMAQIPNTVVISQVYGGGGNAGAQYRNDFVELYNPTAAAVNLAGWSLQYAAIDGSNWNNNRVTLSGVVGAGRYYLVQLAGGANGALLPTPDLVPLPAEVFNMAASGGKIALVNTTNPLSGVCPKAAPTVADFIGWGSAAALNCYEGSTGGGAATGNTTAIHRRTNGCTDANDNAADLFELAPTPRNSAAQAHSCGTIIGITAVTPVPFCVDAVTAFPATLQYNIAGSLPASLSVLLSDATGSFGSNLVVGTASAVTVSGTISLTIPAGLPSSTAYRLQVNGNNAFGVAGNAVEVISGAKNVAGIAAFPDQAEVSVQWQPPTGCVDEYLVVAKQGGSINATPAGDGTNYVADPNFGGNGTIFDGGRVVYKGTGVNALVRGLSLGAAYYFKIFTRKGSNWSSGIETTSTTRIIPAPGEVLINSFSPRYATASDEFYELVNTTGKTFNLADLTLQYQNAAGSGRLPLLLGNTLLPHSFWLLAPGAGVVNIGLTATLQSDFSSGSGVADNGYVALVRRKDNLVIDAVGYGNANGGTFFEGALLPALPGSGGAYRRVVDGTDGNNNATDFTIIPPAQIDLRNSSSRLANTGAQLAGGNYRRIYVTGNSSIAGNITLSEKLVFVAGRLALGAANLALNTIEGAGAGSYVQTNGSGVLTVNPPAAAPYLVGVGSATYNPLILTNGNGTSWQVRVQDGVSASGSERSVLRTWQVQPQGTPAANASLGFVYNETDPAQLGASFTSVDGLQVWHYGATNWVKAGSLVPATPVSGSMRAATLVGYPSFGSYVVASALAVLPVHFAGLQLVEQSNGRDLWFTAQNELAINRYEIEWSPSGQQFQTIGTLQPRNNRGGIERYRFTDNRPLSGMHYYRVRAVEQNDESFFSPVVSWTGGKVNPRMLVYPAPATGGVLHYAVGRLMRGHYQLRVADTNGKVMWATQLQHEGGSRSGVLTVEGMKAGVYYLVLEGPQRLVQPFVVQ